MLKRSIISHIKHFKLKDTEIYAQIQRFIFHREKRLHGNPTNKLQEEVHLDEQAAGRPEDL